MNAQSQPLKSLIIDVALLCERTRELAQSGQQHLGALEPLRESLETVRRALDSLAACWELESLSPALPSLPAPFDIHDEAEASEDWLFGDGRNG